MDRGGRRGERGGSRHRYTHHSRRHESTPCLPPPVVGTASAAPTPAPPRAAQPRGWGDQQLPFFGTQASQSLEWFAWGGPPQRLSMEKAQQQCSSSPLF